MRTPIAVRSRAGRGVLTATIVASGMSQLDATIVAVALPRIGADLGVGLSTLQWIVNAYAFALAGLILLGGGLGDRFGRRRIFLHGVVWFAVASAVCALAPTGPVLVAARGLQGIAAALMVPGSLAIIRSVFGPEDRGAAIGVWSSVSAVASAVGPLLGGALAGASPWGWRLAFLINLPLAVLVIRAALRHTPRAAADRPAVRFDRAGVVLSAVSLALLMWGLARTGAHGWHDRAAGLAIAAAVIGMAVFVGHERRTAAPVLPPGLFRVRLFTAANIVTLLVYAAISGILFLVPLTLQAAIGMSPMRAGAATLPITVVMVTCSPAAASVALWVGPRLPLAYGPGLIGAGMLLLVRVTPSSSYLTGLLPAMIAIAIGLTCVAGPITTVMLDAAPERYAGAASAVNNYVARTAGVLAVAVLPATAGLSEASLLDPVGLTAGFHRAAVIAGVACVAGGVIGAVLTRRRAEPTRSVVSPDLERIS